MKENITLITIFIALLLFASIDLPLSGVLHIPRNNDPQSMGMGYTGGAYTQIIAASDINPAGVENMMQYEAHS